MNIQISPKDFLRKFRLVSDASAKKDIRPILQNVKIVADKDDGVILMATDADLGVRVRVDCQIGWEIPPSYL